MKILKRIWQLFSVATIAIGIATCFFPPLWPITVSFAGIALLFWGTYGAVSYFRSNIKPPVRNSIPISPLRSTQSSAREIRLKELRKLNDELKEEIKKRSIQLADLKNKNKSLKEAFAAEESKMKLFEEECAAIKSNNKLLKEVLAAEESKMKSLEEKLSALEKKLKPARRHSFSAISLPKLFKPVRRFSFDDAFSTAAKTDNSSPAKILPGNLAHKLPR